MNLSASKFNSLLISALIIVTIATLVKGFFADLDPREEYEIKSPSGDSNYTTSAYTTCIHKNTSKHGLSASSVERLCKNKSSMVWVEGTTEAEVKEFNEGKERWLRQLKKTPYIYERRKKINGLFCFFVQNHNNWSVITHLGIAESDKSEVFTVYENLWIEPGEKKELCLDPILATDPKQVQLREYSHIEINFE